MNYLTPIIDKILKGTPNAEVIKEKAMKLYNNFSSPDFPSLYIGAPVR